MDSYQFCPDLIVEVTNACNMRCIGCYAPNEFVKDGSINSKVTNLSFMDLTLNWPFTQKLKTVAVRGGEPTLNSNILEILGFLTEKAEKVFLETNGLWIGNNTDFLESLIKLKINLKLSIDKMHGSSSARKEKIIRVLEEKEIDISFAITTTEFAEFNFEKKTVERISLRKFMFFWQKKATATQQLVLPKLGVIGVDGKIKKSVTSKFGSAIASWVLVSILFFSKEYIYAKNLKNISIGIASNFSEASSSSSNPFGNYFGDGISLALAEKKDLLKRSGIEITLKKLNYGTSQTKILEIVPDAVKSDIIAVVGYNYSSHALMAGPLHIDGRLPMITPSATANRLDDFSGYIHSTCFNNRSMGNVLALIARDTIGAKRVAVVVAKDCAYCQDLSGSFIDAFKGVKTDIKVFEVLDSDTDFDSIANAIALEPKFDAILVPNHEFTSAKIISALISKGINVPFMGGDGWGDVGNEFFGIISKSNIRGFSLTHWHKDQTNVVSRNFIKNYKKEYGKLPNDTAVLAYDSMSYLLEVIIKEKAYSRESLELALKKNRKYLGASGISIFSDGKSPKKSTVVLEIKNHSFNFLKMLGPQL